MKLRNGFVSNSSSSSFVMMIDAEDAAEAVLALLEDTEGFKDLIGKMTVTRFEELKETLVAAIDKSAHEEEVECDGY